jgi:hypothetical protein
VGAAFRTLDERRDLILNAVRLGALSDPAGQQSLKMAIGLVQKYAPGGKAAALAVESGLKRDLEMIPAEIVADQAVRLLKADQLFVTARELESAAYQATLPSFDSLSVNTKSMLGALLDYAGIDRERFANSWKAHAAAPVPVPSPEVREGTPQANLFGEGP